MNKKISKIVLIGISLVILILMSGDPTYNTTEREGLKVFVIQPNNIKKNLNTVPNNKNFELTIWPENSYKLIDLDNIPIKSINSLYSTYLLF